MVLLTTETDGGRTHTHVLGDLDEGVGHLRGVGALGLHADGGGLGADSGHHVGAALHGVEGSVLAGGSYKARRVNKTSRPSNPPSNPSTKAIGIAIEAVLHAIGAGIGSLPE